MTVTALIADDEPLLRDSLARALAEAWPELEVVALARNGREALEQFERLQPDIVFLDVHMPGLNGVEAARQIARRAHIVFVTAYEQYAIQAFEHGALDYLVKPLDALRLADTVGRLKARLASEPTAAPTSTAALEAVITQLLERLGKTAASPPPVMGSMMASEAGPACGDYTAAGRVTSYGSQSICQNISRPLSWMNRRSLS